MDWKFISLKLLGGRLLSVCCCTYFISWEAGQRFSLLLCPLTWMDILYKNEIEMPESLYIYRYNPHNWCDKGTCSVSSNSYEKWGGESTCKVSVGTSDLMADCGLMVWTVNGQSLMKSITRFNIFSAPKGLSKAWDNLAQAKIPLFTQKTTGTKAGTSTLWTCARLDLALGWWFHQKQWEETDCWQHCKTLSILEILSRSGRQHQWKEKQTMVLVGNQLSDCEKQIVVLQVPDSSVQCYS